MNLCVIYLVSAAADKHKGHFLVTMVSESELSEIEPASISPIDFLIMIIWRLFVLFYLPIRIRHSKTLFDKFLV
jgi:hypothetical protein